jgi:hypothetical protein
MKQAPLLDVDPAARRAFDYYPTPAWMTRALLRRVAPRRVLEPCCGEGAITDVLRERGITVLTNDFDRSRAARWNLDATKLESWREFASLEPLWVVTNPPFNLADQIVPHAAYQGYSVAMVLRLSWLEPTEARADFLYRCPPTQLIVMPRHDFKGRGATDSVTSAWFIWDESASGIDIVTKVERDELIAMERK